MLSKIYIYTLLAMGGLSKPVFAEVASIELPSAFRLSTIAEGAETMPAYFLTVTADESNTMFEWKAICFPNCKPDHKIGQLAPFFADFGLTEENLTGITRITLLFNRQKMCRQLSTDVAALRCSARDGGDRTVKLSFAKEDGTKIDMENLIHGYFDAIVATRIERGFTAAQPTPYLIYDVHVSAVGRRADGTGQSAYGVFDFQGFKLYNVIVNGVQNP